MDSQYQLNKIQDVGEWLDTKTPAARLNALRDTVEEAVKYNNRNKARKVLRDFNYISAKIEAFGIDDLLTDYELAQEAFPGKSIALIQSTIRNAYEILSNDPSQLAAQLWAFLRPDSDSRIERLLLQAQSKQQVKLWLKPLTTKTTNVEGPSTWIMNSGEGGIARLVSHPDGKHFCIGYHNGSIVLWDIITNRKKWHVKQPAGVTELLITSNGLTVVTAGEDGNVRVWDTEEGELVHCLWKEPLNTPAFQYFQQIHSERQVDAMAFFQTESIIIAGYYDGTLIQWDIKDGTNISERFLIADFLAHSKIATLVSWPGNSFSQLLMGHEISTNIHFTQRNILYDTFQAIILFGIRADNSHFAAAFGGGSPVTRFAITSNGEVLVALHKRRICIYERDRDSSEIVRAREINEDHTIEQTTSTALSPDGSLFAIGYTSGKVKLFESESLENFAIFEGHRGDVHDVAFSRDGKYLVSGSLSGDVRVWRVEKGLSQRISSSHDRRAVISLAVNPNNNQILSGSWDSNIIKWDLEKRLRIKSLKYLNSDGRDAGEIEAIEFLPGNKRFVTTAGRENYFSIWDFDDEEKVYSSEEISNSQCHHNSYITCIKTTSDGRHIITGSYDNTVKVWRISSERPLFGKPDDERVRCNLIETLSGHQDEISNICITRNNHIAISCCMCRVIAWDLRKRKFLREYKNLSGGSSIALFKDNRYFLLGHPTGCLFIADINEDFVIPPIGRPEDWHRSVIGAFLLPDERYAASVGPKQVKLWDLHNRKLITSYTLDNTAHSSLLTPDGKLLVIGDEVGVVNFISIQRGEEPFQRSFTQNEVTT